MKKRILAILLCVCMTVCALPAVFAAEETGNFPVEEPTVSAEASAGCVETSTPVEASGPVEMTEASVPVPSETDHRRIEYATRNVTTAAPFLPPVTGQGMMTENYAGKKPAPDNGLETSKSVSQPDENGVYTLTLEAWATGEKTIIDQQTQIPTDIILVLDQSGSMGYDFETAVYRAVSGTSADLYQIRKDLYVKRTDGSYAPVSVEVQGAYTPYSGKTNSEYYNMSENFYHNCPDGSYGTVTVDGGRREYTYICSHCGYIGRSYGKSRPAGDFSADFYLRDGVAGYVFSYPNLDGRTVTEQSGEIAPAWEFYIREVGAVMTRLDALKKAVTAFAGGVAEKAKGADGKSGTEDDVNHRIAMVGFASGEKSFRNTEILIGETQYGYRSVTEHVYRSAFQNMNQPDGVSNIKTSIGILDANGGTFINYGMELANGILDHNRIAPGEKRNRVVIVFTDGKPGSRNFDKQVANSAITEAGITKNTHKATVYSVGIFEGADATSVGNQKGETVEKCNWFMQNLSSNNGTVQTPSYYLSAGDSDALNKIFETISDNIETGGSGITLGTEAVLKDVISDSFALPQGATTDDIKIYTADCIGENAFAERKPYNGTVTVSEDGNSVSVTGFDYAGNWVGSETNNGAVTYRGKKLIVEIPICVRDGFLGGNNVPTNGADSGIYNEGKAVEHFEVPAVNVEIPEIIVTAEEKNVYLFGGVTQEELMQGVSITAGGVDLQNAEPWQTAYVDIAITKPEALMNLTGDQTYTVSAIITPQSGDSTVEKNGSSTAPICVFTPAMTFRDSTVCYGGDAPADFGENLISTDWNHGKTVASDVAMIGTEPVLNISYTTGAGIDSGKINTKTDIPVHVAVTMGNADIGGYVSFAHESCAGGCGFDPNEEAFLLHVTTCQLTIQKTGGTDGEPYVFYVFKDGAKYTELTVTGNGTAVIKELPVGIYSVREDGDWAWRYRNVTVGPAAALNCKNQSGLITCTNSDPLSRWLNGFSTVVENILGVSPCDA